MSYRGECTHCYRWYTNHRNHGTYCNRCRLTTTPRRLRFRILCWLYDLGIYR